MPVASGELAGGGNATDDFAVPQGCEKELREHRPRVERLFGICLNILGVLSQAALPVQGGQQIWLQLQGPPRNVERAKDYIKGLCAPEIMEDTSYPRDMHSIFIGAQGIFLDCLIRATSACVKPLTPGRVRISGLVEGVVMAQSRIHVFVECFTLTSSLKGQEAQLKREFKNLVEEYSDHHVLDLLILPTSVKEQLLVLVHEDNISGLVKHNVALMEAESGFSHDCLDVGEETWPLTPTPCKETHGFDSDVQSYATGRTKVKSNRPILHQRACEPHHFFDESDTHYGKPETQPDRRCPGEKPMMDVIDDVGCSIDQEKPGIDESGILGPDEEFQQISGLLDTIMGKDEGEQSPQGVYSPDTQEEFNMLLDFFKTMGFQESIVLKVLSENGIQEPSKIFHKVNLEQCFSSQTSVMPDVLPRPRNPSSGEDDEDYVLGVVKSAVKNCGYSTNEIVNIGDGSVTGLLWKLNEKSDNDRGSSHGQRSANPDYNQRHDRASAVQTRINTDNSQKNIAMPDMVTNKFENHPEEDMFLMGVHPDIGGREGDNKGSAAEGPVIPVVTGAQRFNEAIQKPFQLSLRNEKGNGQLRHVIIDGSNVAMIHGLGRFFSCRGIALAVQFFWDRGHRNITVFVPYFRMKKDNKIKEQHFLKELNEVGLLSFTPSRTVEGKRITSYDDRFMVQLAEKTDGVIVTNDNLRDIYDESNAWKNIIKDRLLQFTFVGDILMVPDDPLGRDGPPLDKFLSKTPQQKPKSKGHSFAGRRAPHNSPKHSTQTEVFNYRDRKPGGHELEDDCTDIRGRRKTERLRHDLLQIFPSQHMEVDYILQREPRLNDLNKLSELLVTLRF
uniref:NEDD4-binding protein 1 n=1 Tax=Leptobrachium leishanense TaxID=445787 RepID=A0A8C5M109_9ANUR